MKDFLIENLDEKNNNLSVKPDNNNYYGFNLDLETNNISCNICLENIQRGEKLSLCENSNNNSLHIFHFNCIEKYAISKEHKTNFLIKNLDCPVCRHIGFIYNKSTFNKIINDFIKKNNDAKIISNKQKLTCCNEDKPNIEIVECLTAKHKYHITCLEKNINYCTCK